MAFAGTVLGAAVLLQVLLVAAPGDPIDLVPNGEELRPQLEAAWHLDQPPLERVLSGVGRALRGELGTSLSVRPGAPVAALVEEALRSSLGLLLPALVLSMGAALGLAWVTAGRSSAARRVVQLLSAGPVFLLAWLLVSGIDGLTWALVQNGSIARPDWFALPDEPSLLRTSLGILCLALGSGTLAELHAACEDELVRLRNSPFIDAARALGTPVWPHLAWNLVPALASLGGSRVAWLLGGLIVVEKVLLLGGAGALLWEAALQRDYPLALGLGLGFAVLVAAARWVSDLVRSGVDPRLRGAR